MNNLRFQFIQNLEFKNYYNSISLNTMFIRNNAIYKFRRLNRY